MGYIYLLENSLGKETTYKIGFTNNIEQRIEQIKTSNAGELNMVYTFETKYGMLLERHLHRMFVKKHMNREWFILNDNDVYTFLDKCKRAEHMFDSLGDNVFFNKK